MVEGDVGATRAFKWWRGQSAGRGLKWWREM